MLICMAIAYHYKFFRLAGERKVSVRLTLVILSFSIFLFCSLYFNPILNKVLLYTFNSDYSENFKITLLSILNGFGICLLLFIMFWKWNRDVLYGILKESNSPLMKDVKIGLFAWPVAFTAVLFTSNLLEDAVYLFFNLHEIPDQVAIGYVKSTLGNFWYLLIALSNVVIFAPLLEEFLYRGVLQTYLNQLVGRTSSIFLTSIMFALSHFAPSQGYSNIIIIGSLIVFSLFLCFVYERQKSLIAPIVLHAMFNGISIINLLLFKGS